MSTDPSKVADLSARRRQHQHERYADRVMKAFDRLAATDRFGARADAQAAEKAERFARFDTLNSVRRKARDTL